MHRNPTIRTDRQVEQELLEIRPVVFVVAPRDGARGLHPLLAPRLGLFVSPEKGHGRGIVVKLVQVDRKLTHHVARGCEDQRRPVRIEQVIETPSHAVIVQRRDLLFRQPQQIWRVLGRPFSHAVDGFTAEEDILHENQESVDWSNAAAGAGTGQIPLKKLLQSHPPDNVIDDRQAADSIRRKRNTAGPVRPPGASRS